jgi:hypothetical protein
MDKELLDALNKKFEQLQLDLKAAQDAGASKEEVTKLHEAIKAQGTALATFIENQQKAVVQTYMEQFASFIGENKDQLALIVKNKAGVIEFIPKAVGAIATTSGGDGVIVPPPNHNTEAGGFNFRNDDPLVALCTVTNTNSASYAYTEYVPKDGNYDFVAEGGVKPEIDFTWQNRYATPYKIAAHEVLSEEVVTDIPRLESTAREILAKKHGLFKANAIYFGVASPTSPEGATEVGRPFNPAGMLNLVSFPNIMDVINACITDIYRTHNYVDEAPYMANIAMINPVDFFLHLVAAKDQNGLPLYPQAGLFNQVTIGGTTIKPWSKIPVGNIFVADMSKYNVANYVPFSIRVGWINDQFITNQFTMVGESRFFAYVKQLDRQAFIYDSIQTIKTAIEKPIV